MTGGMEWSTMRARTLRCIEGVCGHGRGDVGSCRTGCELSIRKSQWSVLSFLEENRRTLHQFSPIHLTFHHLISTQDSRIGSTGLTSPVFSSTVMTCPKDSCRSLTGTPRFAIVSKEDKAKVQGEKFVQVNFEQEGGRECKVDPCVEEQIGYRPSLYLCLNSGPSFSPK